MKIKCTMPEGAILSRMLPTKAVLPQSKRVAGAFAHHFMLGEGRNSIHVTLHVKVRSQGELHRTTLWRMQKISDDDEMHLDLQLSPARADEQATVQKLALEPVGRKDRYVTVIFVPFGTDTARHRRAEQSLAPWERRIRHAESVAARM